MNGFIERNREHIYREHRDFIKAAVQEALTKTALTIPTPVPLWERALVALARGLERLSTWLWRRGAARTIERRNRLNTPWETPWEGEE